MRKTRVFLAGVPLLLFAVSLGAQDAVKVGAKQCKVEFENDYVRVLRWNVGPGENFTFPDPPSDPPEKFGRVTTITFDDESQEIHTSCSQPIGAGSIFGQFEVVSGSSVNGGDPAVVGRLRMPWRRGHTFPPVQRHGSD